MYLESKREIATSYLWDVENFTSLAKLVIPGGEFQSPVFNAKCSHKAWRFRIYPNGKSNQDYIGFYFSRLKRSSDETKYKYTLSIGRPEAIPVKSKDYFGVCINDCLGEELFLEKKSNSWILSGPIRFRCDITEVDQMSRGLTNTSTFKLGLPDTVNLSLDLEQLLNMQFDSDLTVNIDGKKMCVHKCILFARCPTLGFQLGYSTIMKMPSSIDSEINYEIFELLMHYIYTGKLKDSCAPLELFLIAEKLKLISFKQCFYENASNYYAHSAVNEETQFINWNLDELNFWENSSSNTVQILKTKSLYTKQLAIQVTVSEDCDHDKFVDFSFKFFLIEVSKPILLICKITLTSEAGIEAFKDEEHVFLQDEQWIFPRFIRLNSKQQRRMRGAWLSAELRMCNRPKLLTLRNFEATTKIYTDCQTVTDNLERLHINMAFLLQTVESTGNLVLLSSENHHFRVHRAIMWARWPGMKNLIRLSDSTPDENLLVLQTLQLDLPGHVLDILITYFYTGSLPSINRAETEELLNYSKHVEYPTHLVQKCKAFLCDILENQS